MKIKCPHCHTNNQIAYAENIKCERCHKSFQGFTYRIRKISKPLIVSSMIGGAVISQEVENLIEHHRYPLKIEYSFLKSCVGSSYYSARTAQKNLNICACALEKTMDEVDNYNDEKLADVFSTNLKKCR